MLAQTLAFRGLSLRNVASILNKRSLLLEETISSRNISLTAVKCGSGASMWKPERIVSIGTAAIVPLAFMLPSPGMDYAAALVVWAHTHW